MVKSHRAGHPGQRKGQVQTAGVVQAQAADRSMVGMQRDGGVDGDDEDMCVVCWERPKEVIFLSCGHMVSLSYPLPQRAVHWEAIAPFLHQASAAHPLPSYSWQASCWSLPLCHAETRHARDSLVYFAVRLPGMCSRHHGRGAPLLLPHVQEQDLVNDASQVLSRHLVLGSTQLQPCGTPLSVGCSTAVPISWDNES